MFIVHLLSDIKYIKSDSDISFILVYSFDFNFYFVFNHHNTYRFTQQIKHGRNSALVRMYFKPKSSSSVWIASCSSNLNMTNAVSSLPTLEHICTRICPVDIIWCLWSQACCWWCKSSLDAASQTPSAAVGVGVILSLIDLGIVPLILVILLEI